MSQLNHDLVALGDADRADIAAAGLGLLLLGDGGRGGEAAVAPRRLRPVGVAAAGVGGVRAAALRVSQVTGSLGGPADGPVLAATSDQHVVTVPLDAAAQGEVKAGDPVTVTLPDGTTTPGAVSSVGTVAATSGSGGTRSRRSRCR